MVSTVLKSKDLSTWSELQWRRRLETFGADDGPVIASGPGGEFDGVCNPGELTNRGRETTTMLGQRLRHLYVDQLAFMPKLIADADMLYLRCTPIPRALESLQQTLIGLYPLGSRTADFPPPTILLRTPQDETLYPNDGNCRRFAQLSRAFAQRTADRWNSTDDMAYITKKIGKWMPPTTNKDGTESPQPVAVDSHPRLSGIMDTVNSTRAHGPETRLPKEFYDSKFIDTLEKIGVEEWFSGYKESNEYRKLGIGALMGDIVTRMTGSVEKMGNDGLLLIGGEDNSSMKSGRGGETGIKMALSGCHDTTLAAALASLGAFEGDKWPPYTSHIAFELFRKDRVHPVQPNLVKPRTAGMSETNKTQNTSAMTVNGKLDTQGSWWSRLFGSSSSTKPKILQPSEVQASGIARRPMTALSPEEKDKLEGYYVRIRYNDEVMSVPGCRPAGKHLEGDETFCTLVSVLKFTSNPTKQRR